MSKKPEQKKRQVLGGPGQLGILDPGLTQENLEYLRMLEQTEGRTHLEARHGPI